LDKIKDWKRQFFEVKTIGPTPKETASPWKKFKPVEIKPFTPDRKEFGKEPKTISG
jgi:uncharacterized membrane protein YvbJ